MVKQLTINGTGWWVFRDTLEKFEDFKTYGNLRGEKADPYRTGYTIGALNPVWLEGPEGVRNADYIVYSYQTPIAWHVQGFGWIMPDTKYSVTTSKAQSRIRPAVSALNEAQYQ